MDRNDQDPSTKTLNDNVSFQKGAYTAFIAPFNVGSLHYRSEYDEKILLDKNLFPDDVSIEWTYPSDDPASAIKAFLAIDYGDYNHTKALAPIRSSKIRLIQNLAIRSNIILSGDLPFFDVIIDYYLTAKLGDLDTKLIEIEIALHTPPFFKKYADAVKPIGLYRSVDGTLWKLSLDEHAAMMQGKPDILIYPTDQEDRSSVTVDIQSLHRFLIDQHRLTGEEYFNGLALGVEPQQKSGMIVIESLSVSYSARP